jgi:hypothetical protein
MSLRAMAREEYYFGKLYICVYSIVPEVYGNTTHYLHPSWDSRNVEPSLYVLGRSMQLWRTDESSLGMLGRRRELGSGWAG